MTRNVFDNQETAHVWAQVVQPWGRSGNGNLYFDGRALFSYGSHFLVGLILPEGVAVLNADSYSLSTSKHQTYARRATSHMTRLTVPCLSDIRYPLTDFATGNKSRAKGNRATVAQWAQSHVLGAHRVHVELLLDVLGMSRSIPKIVRAAEKAKRAKDLRDAKTKHDEELRSANYYARRTAERLAQEVLTILDPNCTYVYPSAEYFLKKESKRMLRSIKWCAKQPNKKRLHKKLKENRAAARSLLKRLDAITARRHALSRVNAHIKELRLAIAFLSLDNPTRDQACRYLVDAGAEHTAGRDADDIRHARDIATIRCASHAEAIRDYAKVKATRDKLFSIYVKHKNDADRAEQHMRERTEAARIAKERERVEKQRVQRELWLAGGSVSFYGSDENGSAYLRAVDVARDENGAITAGTLETSQGARVPLVHAIRVFRHLKHCKDAGRTWHKNGAQIRVGHYSIDTIKPDGSFVAGCHNIGWEQVERVARGLGLTDIAPEPVPGSLEHA